MDRAELAARLIADYSEEGIRRVKLGVTDVDGVIRGKYISLDKFEAIAADTSGFCDCVLGWDVADELYDNATFTGWHTGFPDALYRLDLESRRRLPDEDNVPYFVGEFVQADRQSLHPICPRSRLKHVLAQAAEAGFGARMAFEYEFFIFDETPHTIREKNYTDLVPLTPGMFGYSMLRANTLSDLMNEFMDYCIALDVPLEGLHCETGPGVWEAALAVDDCLRAADKAVLFKTFAKSFFQKRGLTATFMAKWSMDYPGQSGHLHQSLHDVETGEGRFHDPAGDYAMSDTMRRYVAGLHRYLPEFLALTSPNINSYTRLVKGAWAPTAATWGVENRTSALRVISGSSKSQRVEFRVGSADANPYLVAAANLSAGLLGIRDAMPLPEPVVGNAYDLQESLPAEQQFDTNLRDANRRLNGSAAARQMLGEAFIDHYVASRDWEVREYERHVNSWQLQRYFEII